jgi:C4-dicarboxylate-binding protein DctP
MKTKKISAIILILSLISTISVFSGGAKEEAAVKKAVHYKFGTIQPADAPVGKGATKFAELVKEKSKGAVIIDVYPASQLGNEKELMDGVEMGTIQFALGGVGEWAKRFKPIMIFEGPFVFRDRDHLLKTFDSDIGKSVIEDMVKKVGIRSLGLMYYGTRYVTTGKVAAKTPAEMKGLKLRCPDQPLYVQVTKAMGATPTPMAFSEVYLALQQGVVDGQENPPATIATMKFYEVQKYLIKTGHIISGVQIWAKEQFLTGLPKEDQGAIKSAAVEASKWANSNSFQLEDEFLTKLGTEFKMTLVEPDQQAFITAAQPLLESYEKEWGPGLLEKVRSVK